MRYYMSILVTLLVCNFAIGQEMKNSDKKKFEKATEKRKFGAVDEAAKSMESLVNDYPENFELLVEYGITVLELGNDSIAIQSFEKAVEIEPKESFRLWFTLANLYKNSERFKEAHYALDQFFSFENIRDTQKEQAARLKEQLYFVEEAINNPVDFSPEKLPGKINTTNSEYLPAFTADGAIMYYTTRLNGQEDFFISKIANDTFQIGEPIFELNTEKNEAAHCVSPSGKYLFFTGCDFRDGLGSCDIYVTRLNEGKWIPPINMGAGINTRYWESQPTITSDGKRIYFSSDRPGGIGKKDIWYTDFVDGSWTKPINAGEKINTIGNESSPFIHSDNQTLYFRSDHFLGMGGYDIFITRKETDDWSIPKNLGYPINTIGDEGALSVSADAEYAYYASDAGEINTQLDIFRFKLPEELKPLPVSYFKANVFNAETEEPLVARLTIIDIDSKEKYFTSVSNDKGELLGSLPSNKNLSIHVERDGYVFHSENFYSPDTSTLNNPIVVNIYLQPIVPVKKDIAETKPVVLRNIFFETGSANLLSSSDFELLKLVSILNQNKDKQVRITGHTDDVGSDTDNQRLSEKRANAVKDFLTKNGISADRISAEGKGESEPIAENETEDGKRTNRRVEFVLISR